MQRGLEERIGGLRDRQRGVGQSEGEERVRNEQR